MGARATGRIASRLSDRQWIAVIDQGAHSVGGKVQPWAKKRLPMSATRFRAVQRLLGWSNSRLRAELRVSVRSIVYWRRGLVAVPRTVELALMFCLLRDQPTRVKENSEYLARIL
jgi:hypothetical protein